jgi:uncharacterized membrane protein YbhN (UPF0104 family)
MKISASKIIASAAALAAVVAVAAMPQLLGGKVSAAFGSLHGANPRWLAVAGVVFACGFLSNVGAWRAALAASGGRICPRQAAARLGVGSLVNTFAPAKLGDAVKIALCSKAIDGPDRVWTASGVYAALGAAKCLTLAALVVAASAAGALPLWPVFVLLGAVAALAVVARFSPRMRRHRRIAHLLGAIAALERSPRAAAVVLGWSVAIALTRLFATAAVAVAMGVPHPLLAALLILPAIDLASAIPITPGNIGVASGAVAVALQSRGVGVTQALGVGIAIQALETLVSLVAGTTGAFYLLRPRPAVRRWTLRVAAVGMSTGVAALLSFFVFDLL